jgi:hypothetical protein
MNASAFWNQALQNALMLRQPQADLYFHSLRGCQYLDRSARKTSSRVRFFGGSTSFKLKQCLVEQNDMSKHFVDEPEPYFTWLPYD